MTTPAAERRVPPPAPREQPSIGPILLGLLLVLIGAAWLVDITGVLDVSWGLVLSVALIGVGIALILASRTGAHGGLITLGIVLTLVLAIASVVDVDLPPDASVGDRTVQPATAADLQDDYAVGVGNLTLDLTDLTLPPGDTSLTASVGIGEVEVRVPDDVGVRVHWRVGLGDAEILGRERSGAGLEDTYATDNYDSAASRLDLELSTGLGSIEVR